MRSPSVHLEWEGKAPPAPPRPIQLHRLAEIALPANREGTPNRLILGDNLNAMDAILPTMQGKFRILYADPPFATGKVFTRRIGREEDSRQPTDWKLGAGYSDSWASLDDYLGMLYLRLSRMRELLAEDGTLFLHLDWRATSFARILLDEIFGADHFLNEIIWVYHGPSPVRAYFNRKHDTILVYAKGNSPLYLPDRVRVPYNPSTRKTFASSTKAGFGKQPDLDRGKIPEDWWYFPVVARLHSERTGYPTQKPEALLERIIRTASNEGDWVGDFFCGSGTTMRVADALGRRWVGSDITPASIHICQRRLALGHSSPYWIDRLEEDASASFLGAPNLEVSFRLQARSAEITLVNFPMCHPDGFPASLDYWEVDFQYDGEIFRSMSQSARPWRQGGAALTISHTYSQPGRYRALVRAICANGIACHSISEVNIS